MDTHIPHHIIMKQLSSRIGEPRVYAILACAMGVFYFYSAFLSNQIRYGFNQLSILGFPIAAGFALVIAGLLILIHNKDHSSPSTGEPIPLRRLLLPATLAAILLMPLFWMLKNGFINSDGLLNMQSLLFGVRIMSHDEMLSTFIITKIWESGILGFRPENSISAFSVFFGGFYVWVSVILGGRLTGKRWPLFLILCLSSGFVQMFVGDVEFYAMVAAMTALYLLMVLEHLRGRISILLPAITLAFAISSHLLAGWLLPSFLFLCLRSIKRKEWGKSLISVLVLILVTGLIFVIVTDAGLPMRNLTYSHAMGSADKGTLDMLAQPSITYYASVINVLFLLFPLWLMIPLMYIYKRIEFSPYNIFLGICLFMLLLLAFVWYLGLGPYYDWNLIATTGVPASVLVWGNLLKGSWVKGIKTAVWALLLISALHSWTWIVNNNHQFSDIPEEHRSHLSDIIYQTRFFNFTDLIQSEEN